MELLEEAIQNRVEDMKRHLEADMVAAAQTICAGIVAGLYACRNKQSAAETSGFAHTGSRP